MLTLDEIKSQLRLESDFTDEDDLLMLMAKAVLARTETFLNRHLYPPDSTIPDSDPDGLPLSADLRLAMLLLITHFYENRSTVTEIEKMELPMGFQWLAGPYRIIPL